MNEFVTVSESKTVTAHEIFNIIRLIECESFILSIISTLPVYRDELEKKYSIVPPYVEKKNVKNIVGRYEVHLISENDKEEINYLININKCK